MIILKINMLITDQQKSSRSSYTTNNNHAANKDLTKVGDFAFCILNDTKYYILLCSMTVDVLTNVLMQKVVKSCSKWLQLDRVQHKHHCWNCTLLDDMELHYSYICILDRQFHQNDGQIALSFSSSSQIKCLELMKVIRWFGNTSTSSHLQLNDGWHSFLLQENCNVRVLDLT